MSERMLKCKQCGLELPETEFKQYVSRSQGFRNTTTGRYTICKHCEKMSAYAAKLQKKFEAGTANERELEERVVLVGYYRDLVDRGLPLVTAAVRRLMGVEEPQQRSVQSTAMRMIAEAQQRRDDCLRPIAPLSEEVREMVDSGGFEKVSTTEEGWAESFRTSDPRDILPKPEQHMQTMDNVVDTGKIMGAIDILNELLERELVREPAYYEAECSEALDVLRGISNDGKVPSAYTALASQVLERLDDYALDYEG